MATKKYGFLGSVLSTSVLLLLLLFSTVSLVLAPKITSWPTGTIQVTQGETFTLQHKFEWDEAGAGFYSVALYWWYWGLDDWHFTIDNYRAYFENGAQVECTKSEVDNGDLLSILLRNTVADARDGVFYVDLKLRAQGPLGTDHAVTDNHPILYTKLRCNETSTTETTPGAVAIKVVAAVRGVDVSISPSLKEGWTGDNLAYGVVVKNMGSVVDTYVLDLTDALGWWYGGITLRTDNITPPTADTYVAENRPNDNYNYIYNMYVGYASPYMAERAYAKFDISSIPSNAVITYAKLYLLTRYGPSHYVAPSYIDDNMWIECWSVDNDSWAETDNINWNNRPALDNLLDNVYVVSDSWVPAYTWWKWDVTPWVASQYAGDNVVSLGLTSMTQEEPTTSENNTVWFYQSNDTAAWRRPALLVTYKPNTGENTGELDPGENWTGQIWVVVSSPPCTTDNLMVTATSTGDNTVSDSATCQAHHAAAGVNVSISPSYKEAWPGVIDFTVTVTNTGDAPDNFALAASSDYGLPVWLDNVVLGPISVGGSASTTLHENLWDNVPVCTTDNITVTATSVHDGTVSDNDTCQAHHAAAGVDVSISPSYKEAWSGVIDFTVTVTNKGDNAQDNYTLAASSALGWPVSLGASVLGPLWKNQSASTTLHVTLWDNVPVCTTDNITVTATSVENNMVSDNATCQAHRQLPPVVPPVVGVDVSISPSSQSGAPGTTFNYTVTVKNTGDNADTFDLGVSGGAGWAPTLVDYSLSITAGASKTTTLRVTVPSGGTSTTITVTARSRADTSVSDSASCTATAIAPPPGPGPAPEEAGIPPVMLVAIVISLLAIILAILI